MYQPLVLCPGCDRHVRSSDLACPFCAAALDDSDRARVAPDTAQRLGRAAAFVFGATVAMTACGSDVVYQGANGAATSGGGGTSAGPTGPGSTTSTSTAVGSTGSIAPAYGAPGATSSSAGQGGNGGAGGAGGATGAGGAGGAMITPMYGAPPKP